MTQPSVVTQLLARAGQGETGALDDLFAVVYGELHRLAQAHLRREHAGHTLNATALVNEACLKLLGRTTAGSLNDRQHFFAVASRAMRQILLDHARARLAQKRGGGLGPHVTLGDQVAGEGRDEETLIALNDALTQLAQVSERLGRLVELRYFAGLDDAEIAAILGVSVRTVNRDWRTARAFLSRHLQDRG
jgi:RNA polymerase sigma factor (TIGR02999 family)